MEDSKNTTSITSVDVESWLENARKVTNQLKDESYELLTEIIKEHGQDCGEDIIFNVEDSDINLYVMEYGGFDGDYIGRDITTIELSKEYGGISLIYGEEDYEYISFEDVLLSDRIYIIDQLSYLLKK